ncbi:MAG: L,D-transpeptidase family protein, partial [Clostridia bacterium]|nr:L,D-transpeptidase family protein [Clostridia bacterium]
GSPASSGCVRLTVADALWIYTYCEVGTTVEVVNDRSLPDYATYITPKKLSGSYGWDPTDPNPNNPIYEPWPSYYPQIWGSAAAQQPGAQPEDPAIIPDDPFIPNPATEAPAPSLPDPFVPLPNPEPQPESMPPLVMPLF